MWGGVEDLGDFVGLGGGGRSVGELSGGAEVEAATNSSISVGHG